jgi:glucokinase
LKGAPFAFAKTEDEIASLCTLDIAGAAKAGDPNALAVFKTVGERLGQGLSMLIDTLNPDAIVIGSVYARCEELLSPFARRVIEKEALPAAAAHCKLLPAALGEKIGDVAALTVAAEVNYV